MTCQPLPKPKSLSFQWNTCIFEHLAYFQSRLSPFTTPVFSKLLLGHNILIFHGTNNNKKSKWLAITDTPLNLGNDMPVGFQKALDELWIQFSLTSTWTNHTESLSPVTQGTSLSFPG